MSDIDCKPCSGGCVSRKTVESERVNTFESSESKHRPHFLWDETEAGVCVVGAFDDAIPALAHPERWSLAHPRLVLAT